MHAMRRCSPLVRGSADGLDLVLFGVFVTELGDILVVERDDVWDGFGFDRGERGRDRVCHRESEEVGDKMCIHLLSHFGASGDHPVGSLLSRFR
jgi:hypothetical protein